MKKVDKPNIEGKATFLTCISIVRNPSLKNRLLACEDLIEAAEAEYERKAMAELYTIASETIINKNVTAKELEKVYTFRMVKKDTPGREIYDKLMSAQELGVCPLCSHRPVETLDHYLPKKDFPRLTTTPVNLVPSCFTCNKLKLSKKPSCLEEETLHPYYDDIDNDNWLVAKVNHTTPPSITYSVAPPDSWPDSLKIRVNNHFNSLDLNKLYSTQAAVLLRGLFHRLDSIYNMKGSDGVRKYLESEAESRYMYDKNSWETSFYKAICIDNWFCDGGFKLE